MKKINQKTITVVTEEENPVAVELVAEAIISIADSFKKMNESRLKRRALILLIKDNCGQVGGRFNKSSIGTREIEEVLNSIESLKQAYIKDLPKKK